MGLRERTPLLSVEPEHFPLWRPELERDSCGVGFAVDVRRRASHELLQRGLTGLARLAHRGPVASLVAPDGAGILTGIPWPLLAEALPRRARTGGCPRLLGTLFVAAGARATVTAMVERTLARRGWRVVAWRDVPVDRRAVPASAGDRVAPDILHVVAVSRRPAHEAERAVYAARLAIVGHLSRMRLANTALVSLSTSTTVYKGLVAPGDLGRFYQDLADPRFETPFVLFHQRFSTNTLPEWPLAQPFSLLAHNGEINTIAGNRRWLHARQQDTSSIGRLRLPDLMRPGASDSESLNEAVELLRSSGMDLPHAFSRLVPPAWERDCEMPRSIAAFYEYQAAFTEPWEGPAAIVFADGRTIGALLDRNGFRPARYTTTRDGQVFLGSEVGIFDVADREVRSRGRLGPGSMIAVDLADGTVATTADIRHALACRRPYEALVARSAIRLDADRPTVAAAPLYNDDELARLQKAFGYTREEIRLILQPLAMEAREAVGSMGDDAPLAVLSSMDRLLPDFFRQRFAQVTNPPMDPLREGIVMSLRTSLGPRGSYVDESEAPPVQLALRSPVLSAEDLSSILACDRLRPVLIETTFVLSRGSGELDRALRRLVGQACRAVRMGASVLILSDRGLTRTRAAMPPLLAAAAVHQAFIARGLRMRASLVVETGEARDPHQLATLVAYGVSAVCPYLACETVRAIAEGDPDVRMAAERRYRSALEDGLLKIMAKMGVATFDGYCGAQLFEIVGLGHDVAQRYFPGTASVLGGIGLVEIGRRTIDRHVAAFGSERPALAEPGQHSYRHGGEYHASNPIVVRKLHESATSGRPEAYGAFARLVEERPPTALRDLLEFRAASPVAIEEVEPVEAICRRFVTAAMSVGALGPEAHRVLAIAMNRIGGRSNSGEGGEPSDRFVAEPGEEWAGSAIKQIASARFGVTPAYLTSGDEIQIKISQGSKPGEGGQLPSHKVVEHIARLRHVTAGTPLISPPVHHDIYSIEDLAQLIHDLRALHPLARISVKLVSHTGVGIVAAGVAKAGADAILISGHDGGTGASPRGSIKHAGLPWEIGLAETQQVLTHHRLRDRVVLQADGGFKTGRDVVVAAALGAEEYGFGTAVLVAVGCVMARQCHLDTCPVGIATQRPQLRAKFAGTPDMVVSYLRQVAGQVREILATLALRSLDELVGRSIVLRQRRGASAGALDLSAVISPSGWSTAKRDASDTAQASRLAEARARAAWDGEWLVRRLERQHSLEIHGVVENTDRAVGARLAGAIATRHGDAGLPDGSIDVRLRGTAGQSFGAFCMPGMRLHLRGQANDYVAKGMHGGEIAVSLPSSTEARPVLAGNTLLYGATGGRLFIAGTVGERFAVRNSGASAVVEGVGDHACEYMTGGTVVVLGPVGRNFANGMTGGMVLVRDRARVVLSRSNLEAVDIVPASLEHAPLLHTLLTQHVRATGSRIARELLGKGDQAVLEFWVVTPRAIRVAPAPLHLETEGRTRAAVEVIARTDGRPADEEEAVPVRVLKVV